MPEVGLRAVGSTRRRGRRPSRPVTSMVERYRVVVEAGREHDRVDGSVRRRRRSRCRAASMRSIGSVTSSTFGRLNAGIVLVRDERPLAAVREVGRELGPDLGILDDASMFFAARLAREMRSIFRVREGDRARRRARRSPGARTRSASGSVAERARAARACTASSSFGQHPVRRALEDGELPDDRRDLGHELHRARGAADHRRPARPARSWSWSQRAEWNTWPANSSRPGMSGHAGLPNMPTAPTTTSNSCSSPASVVSRHGRGARRSTARLRSQSPTAGTSRGRTSSRSARSTAWISGWFAYGLLQSFLSSNENE